jgi:hypothetical protein
MDNNADEKIEKHFKQNDRNLKQTIHSLFHTFAQNDN